MKDGIDRKAEGTDQLQDSGAGQKRVMIFEWDIMSDDLTYYKNPKVDNKYIFHRFCGDMKAYSFINQDDFPAFTALRNSIAQGRLYASAEFRIQEEEGGYRWHRAHAVTQYGKDNVPVRAVGIVLDIDEEINTMDKLRSRAERDSLTGLYNREETENRIKNHLLGRPEKNCALFMIDTDNFKQVNDTKGHMLGDVVLTEMASAMNRVMRESDIVGRIGGDEFTIFMKDIPSREAARKKGESLNEIFRHLFENEKLAFQVTCSIGIAVYPEDGGDFKTLYQHADQALYQAKTHGKNGYMLYDSRVPYGVEAAISTSLGTIIDSENQTAGGQGDLLTDIFKILYGIDDTDQAINLTLEVVGKRFDVSRAYVFESTENGKYSSNTYEWCNDGILPQKENLQHIGYNQAGDYKSLFGDNSIFYCRDVSTLNERQKELLGDQGICSTLQCAYWKGAEFAGFIGFDECTGLRLWTKEEVETLSLISQMMTTFLQKRRAMEWNAEIEGQLRTILDAQDSCIYVIEQNTFELLYLNAKTKELHPGIQLGEYCYKALFGRERMCEYCPLLNGGTGDMEVPEWNIQTEIFASSMKWLGNDAYLISFNMDTAQKSPEGMENVDVNAASEKSIVECIQWLSSYEYLEDAIEYVLNVIQEYYQSDRVYLIETDEKRGICSNTYEICAEGVIPQIDMLREVPIEAISFWMDQFEVRDYIKIDDIEELGEDRRLEHDILKEQGISSLMAIPLYIKGDIKGFLGIDDPKRHKKNFHYLKGLSYFLENEIAKNSLRKSLEQMSYQDAMTGLENRNSYMRYCDDFQKRMPANTGIIFMDINGLKRLNDTRGHMYGDILISHIADLMKEFFPQERKFRLSGDEFLIVTESMAYEEFRSKTVAMEEAFSEEGRCVIAIGSTWSDVSSDLNELMNKADRLMYLNKQDYYKETKEIRAEKIPLLQGLTEAILNKDYLVYLQPKLNVRTNKVDSAEVLVRYREKNGVILSPVKFIPMLESEGLISNIDFFVMEEVCGLLTKWKGTVLSGMKLALNFSRLTLFDIHFFERFWSIFDRHHLKPEQLEIEITETQETLNKKQMALLLDKLKQHGFSIALDDFGVEYSSYEFLMMANFDLLKIDKGIIQKYEGAGNGRILVKHIVDLGHDIGAECCAEGVETEEQLKFAREIGCDYVQGYLIDCPISVEQFEAKYMV